MPQPITINGRNIYRPGVYAKVDVSALAGSALETNRMAIVGNFPFLQQNTIWEFSNPTDLVNFEPSAEILKKISQLVYNGSNDPRVSGGPSALCLISPGASTQASFTLDGQMIIKSFAWGATGKRVVASCKTNGDDAEALDFTFARDGMLEEFIKLKQGPIAKLRYNGADATAVTAKWGPETGLVVEQEVAITGNVAMEAGLNATDDLAWGGEIISFFAADGGLGSDCTFEITGLKDDGVLVTADSPETVTVTIPGGDDTNFGTADSVGKYVRVDTLKLSSGADGNTEFKIKTKAFSLDPTNNPKMSHLVNAINSGSDVHKYALTLQFPKAGNMLTAQLDESGTAVENILNNDGDITSELQFLIDEINAQSDLVVLERNTISEANDTGTKKPTPPANAFNLLGGADDADISYAEWEATFAKLDKSQSIQIIVPMSDDVEVGKRLVTHCKNMAGKGQSECNGWFGAAKAKTIDQLASEYVNHLNSRHVACVGQQIKLTDWLGRTVIYDPWALALICAGVQAGTGIAVPMTHKRVSLLDTIQNDWDPATHADDAIKKGLCIVTRDRLGHKIERSVTTHVLDDNPIFSEVSANESMNTCIRDLRAFVEGRIGDANTAGMADLVKAVAMTRLRAQIEDGVIKAFDEKTLAVVDLGDRLRIDIRIAVVEPINFILINAEVVRNIS